MSKNIFFVGSSHLPENYGFLREQLDLINPDCITLEQHIGSSLLYWDFKDNLDKLELEHKTKNYLGTEFSAGVHHARRNNTPIYFVDIVTSEHLTDINLNDNLNYEIIRNKDYSLDGIGNSKYWTPRNEFMAKAINKHLKNYNNIVHIGGKGHYDSQRCIPLQALINNASKRFIDLNSKEVYQE